MQEQSNQSEVEACNDESGQDDHSQLDDNTQSNVLPEPHKDATRRSTQKRVPVTCMNIAKTRAKTYCQAYRSARAEADENDTMD